MGSFCLKNRDFGPKDKRLRISGDVIKLFVIHPSIQDLSQNAICCLFLKAQRETKTDFGFSNREVENQIFLWFAFLLMKLSDYIMDRKATSVLSVLYTLCCVRSNRYRSHVVSMSPRCDTVVSDENEKCWKTDNF